MGRLLLISSLVSAVFLGRASDAVAQSVSLDPTDPEEFGEIITQCSRAARRATRPNFISGAQIADRYWDGTLGARAIIISSDAVETKEDRIQRLVDSGQVNLTFLVFGLVDTFGGPRQTFKLVECEPFNDGIFALEVCNDRGRQCEDKEVRL